MVGEAEQLNKKIREAMTKALRDEGITAADLAKRLGKTRSYGYQLTTGDRAKVPDSLVAALDVLGLELTVTQKGNNHDQ